MISNPYSYFKIGGKNYGGIETYINNLCLFLSNEHEIHIVSMKGSFIDKGVSNIFIEEINQLSIFDGKKQFKNYRLDYSEFRNKLKNLSSYNFDLVLNFSDKFKINHALNEYFKCPIITHLHNLPIFRNSQANAMNFNKLKNITYVANSQLTLEKWKDLGLNIESFVSPKFLPKQTKLKPINYDCFVNISRFHKDKLVLEYLDCSNLFRDSKIYFDLIGVGYNDDYHSQIKDSLNNVWADHIVNFSGDNDLVHQYLNEIRPIIVTFSSVESFGITPIEGFMWGLPTICLEQDNSNVKNIIMNGSVIYDCDEFIITSLGVMIKKKKGKRFKYYKGIFYEVVNIINELQPFKPEEIYKHFFDNYIFKEGEKVYEF